MAAALAANHSECAGHADGNVTCKSDESWRDLDGDPCTTYDENPDRCEVDLDFALGGIRAKDVCCGCGGSANLEVPMSFCNTGDAECDDENPWNGDGCSVQCTLECGFEPLDGQGFYSICGDGILAGDEQCDDGNTMDEDGCSSWCEVEDGYMCSGGPCALSECVW